MVSTQQSPPHWLPLRAFRPNDPAAQTHTWLGNNGGSIAMLDWEANGGDLSNLTAVVDAFNAAGVTVQLGYYPQWYWSQQGGGNLSSLANALVSSAYPDGSGYASTVYANSGRQYRPGLGALQGRDPATRGNSPTAQTSQVSPSTATPTKATTSLIYSALRQQLADGTTAQLTAAQQHPSRKRRTSPTRKK